MNERFQELAKQAVLQANEVFDQKGKDYMGIVMEKFAELIVKECANYIDAFNREHMVEEGIGGSELKQHFEVKE
jgi:hypothetical protein